MTRVLAIAAVAAVAWAAGVSPAAGSGAGVSWTKAQAEARILRAPPLHWTRRGWTVAAAVCAGQGSPTLVPAKRPGAELRLYPNFSCEITVVRPDPTCPSFGIYTCVAGWESTAEERTLHVLGKSRYALYRV
jgi:hypothetical protein